MAKKIRSFDQLRINMFQALRRAFLYRSALSGPVVPEKKATAKAKSAKQPAKDQSKTTETEGEEESHEEMPTSGDAEVKQTDSPKSSETKAEKADKEAQVGPEELIELTERVHDILYEATTVFPFTLFPDTITLDREKLTIAERFFWRVADITSVPISEILSCTVNVGPFFGSIHLVFSFFADNERRINFLWRQDAMELQRMVHGYIIAHKREINTTGVSTEDLKTLLKEIGHGAAE